MFFSFDRFCNIVKRDSPSKLDLIVFANNVKGYLKGIISIFVVFLILFSGSLKLQVAFGIYIIYVFLLTLIMTSRKMGIGLNDKMIFVNCLNFLGNKSRKVYDIPLDKIKYISVYKIGYINYVKLSFISNEQKFVQLRFVFSNIILGPWHSKQKENAKMMYNRLKEIQKVIDKGDF